VGVAIDVVSPGDDEMWIRFSVANVDDEKVRKVCERFGRVRRALGGDSTPDAI